MKAVSLIFLLIILASCHSYKTELEQCEEQNDSLKAVAGQKDQKVIEFIKAFNDIQMNLEEIKKAQNIIDLSVSETQGEPEEDLKERIIEDINLINDLMEENRNKIQNLEKIAGRSGNKNRELQKLIDFLQNQIESKDNEIASLNVKLEKLNIEVGYLTATVDTLKDIVAEKEREIEEKVSEMNRAWLAVGTEKELKLCNILTKEGGFIGIGKIMQLKQNFELKCFREIDISKTDEINLSTKKARLLTTHPTGTYRFSGTYGYDKLIITDPTKFWSSSKYLVIVIE